MPFISMKITAFSKAKKKELIEELTKASSKVTSIPEEHFLVAIKELDAENIGGWRQTFKRIALGKRKEV